jgi:hypothetical protein
MLYRKPDGANSGVVHMVQMHELSWSKREKQIAHAAFEQALEREAAALLAEVRTKAQTLTEVADLWQLEQFLRDKRRAFEQRYDYRYSVLLYVFADLIQAGWLSLDELAGLADDKRARVAALLEFARGDWEEQDVPEVGNIIVASEGEIVTKDGAPASDISACGCDR